LFPRRLVAHRILSGPLLGARIVTSWHDYPAGIIGVTERSLLKWFQRHVVPSSTWLDIGAHYGYTAVALSRLVGDNGRVFAFEPMPATATCLGETRVLNGLDQLSVLACGLGTPETQTTIRVPSCRGMADGTVSVTDETMWSPIQVAKFDWLWPLINRGNAAVHGVKIDVQGMELDVLEGMHETLLRQQPKLVVEVHRGVDRGALLDLLGGAGYSRVPIPVEPAARGTVPSIIDDRSYEFVPA
jgi:FkbM family methyltransferase